MDKDNGFFRFNIGDLVVTRHEMARYRKLLKLEATEESSGRAQRYYERAEAPHPAIIVERITQECHGGIQRHYRLRSYTSGNQLTTAGRAFWMDLAEFEVEAYDESVPETR